MAPGAVGHARISVRLISRIPFGTHARRLQRFQILLTALPQGSRIRVTAMYDTVGGIIGRGSHRCARHRVWGKRIQGQILRLQGATMPELFVVDLIVFIRVLAVVEFDIGNLLQIRIAFHNLPDRFPPVHILLDQLLLEVVAPGTLDRWLLRKRRVLAHIVSRLMGVETLIHVIPLGYPTTYLALPKSIIHTPFMLQRVGALVHSVPVLTGKRLMMLSTCIQAVVQVYLDSLLRQRLTSN